METRDIKFNGFAVLLFRDVQPLMLAWERANRMQDLALATRIEAQIQTVFAQRGYDLAVHVLIATSTSSQQSARSRLEAEAAIERAPYLAEWPDARAET